MLVDYNNISFQSVGLNKSSENRFAEHQLVGVDGSEFDLLGSSVETLSFKALIVNTNAKNEAIELKNYISENPRGSLVFDGNSYQVIAKSVLITQNTTNGIVHVDLTFMVTEDESTLIAIENNFDDKRAAVINDISDEYINKFDFSSNIDESKKLGNDINIFKKTSSKIQGFVEGYKANLQKVNNYVSDIEELVLEIQRIPLNASTIKSLAHRLIALVITASNPQFINSTEPSSDLINRSILVNKIDEIINSKITTKAEYNKSLLQLKLFLNLDFVQTNALIYESFFDYITSAQKSINKDNLKTEFTFNLIESIPLVTTQWKLQATTNDRIEHPLFMPLDTLTYVN